MKKGSLRSLAFCTLYLGATMFGQSASATWQKTPLATTGYLFDANGFPIFDGFGDPLPALPAQYSPSFCRGANGLRFLRANYATQPDPPIIDGNGFPVFGDYFQFNIATLASGAWSVSAPLTDLSEEVNAPSLVSRLDDSVSLAHWIGNTLHVDTLASPANTRISLPIPKSIGAVSIDENEGLHVLAVNSDYELWHYYYAETTLTSTKLADGPVCDVVTVAGEGDECHVAYSTFSEDANLNEELDEGEDLNGNGILDETPMQLIYQSVDATTPSSIELIDDDTLLKLCAFDLHFSTAHGLKLAYADPKGNTVRLGERSVSSWPSVQVSTVAGMFGSVALAVDSMGGCAISYVNAGRTKLYVAEENTGVWSETLIAQAATGDYFTGTDADFDGADQLAVLTSEKDRHYLNLYSRSTFPDLLSILVRPTEIRSAFVVTWPTPSEDATGQILQTNTDLSDPDGWEFVAQRYVDGSSSGEQETTVENDAPSRFYRVVELSE